MTILEIRNELLTFFLNNDTFSLSKDIKRVKIGKNQEPFREEILISTLDEMVKDGLCHKLTIYESKDTLKIKDLCYVMTVPLGAQSQKIEISSGTAEIIHSLLTQYASANNIQNYIVNKLEINDNDIRNVLGICSELLESQDKEDEE